MNVKNQQEIIMSEEKYVHTINLEIPMDFWLAVEKLLVNYKIKTGEKINKKDFVLKLIDEGHTAVGKELKGPKKTTSSDGDWQTDAS